MLKVLSGGLKIKFIDAKVFRNPITKMIASSGRANWNIAFVSGFFVSSLFVPQVPLEEAFKQQSCY